MHHPAKRSYLRHDDRWPATHGGFLHGKGHRANFPAPDAAAIARSAGHLHARRRNFSQLDSGCDPQVLPGTRAQSDVGHLGSGASYVQQGDRGGG